LYGIVRTDRPQKVNAPTDAESKDLQAAI
jgi:hypothetical protein